MPQFPHAQWGSFESCYTQSLRHPPEGPRPSGHSENSLHKTHFVVSLCFLGSPENELRVLKSLSQGLLLGKPKFRPRITGRRESHTAWLGPHWGSPCLSRPREWEGIGARCPVLPGENQPRGTENGKQPHGPVPESRATSEDRTICH